MLADMKRPLSILTCILSGFILTGCGDSSSNSGDESKSTPPSATQTASEEIKKSTANAADEVAKEVKKQAGEVVAEVQKQAKAVYDDLSKKLVENTKTSTDDLMKTISANLETRVTKLGESLKSNETVMNQLNGALQALLNKKDVDAVGALNNVAAAKLTPEQTTLAKDVYNAGAAYVTQRNFSSLEGMNSDVAKLSTAVLNGNYAEAMPPLQKIYGKSSLTTEQKDLLGSVFDKYLPGWQDKAGVVGKGLDALKKFGQ